MNMVSFLKGRKRWFAALAIPGLALLAGAPGATPLPEATPPDRQDAAPPASTASAEASGSEKAASVLTLRRRVPGDFCLRLLPGWRVQPEGGALRLIAAADRPDGGAAFRLELDALTAPITAGGPLPHTELLGQIRERLGASLRNARERIEARQVFTTPSAAGITYHFQGERRSDGRAVTDVPVTVLIGEGGKRTALLAPLEPAPLPPDLEADLGAMLRAARFLPSEARPDTTQQFSGRLVGQENTFFLCLRNKGDAEAVWKTFTPNGTEMSARFAGSYALLGNRVRAALLRTGGENRYAARLLELDLTPVGGVARGTVRLDDTRQMPIADLKLINVSLTQGRTSDLPTFARPQ